MWFGCSCLSPFTGGAAHKECTLTDKKLKFQTKEVSPGMAGLLCRCPSCGEGKLFSSYLKAVDNCEVCDKEWSVHDSGDGPAVIVIFVIGFIIMFSALLVEVNYGPPLWVHAVLWGPLLLALSLGLLQPLKGFMIGQAFKHRAGEARLEDGFGNESRTEIGENGQ